MLRDSGHADNSPANGAAVLDMYRRRPEASIMERGRVTKSLVKLESEMRRHREQQGETTQHIVSYNNISVPAPSMQPAQVKNRAKGKLHHLLPSDKTAIKQILFDELSQDDKCDLRL